MTYDIVLTGNKIISVTEDQKKKLDSFLLEKESGNLMVTIGKNTIRLSMVKGIFESGTANFVPMNAIAEQRHREWNEECKTMSTMSIQDKIDNEITVRILPMFQKKTVDEVTIAVLRQTMEAFFTVHPDYPRCPSRIWWGIIKEKVEDWGTKWMEFVIRSDGAVEDYVTYRRKTT